MKRILSLALCAALLLCGVPLAGAVNVVSVEEAAQTLAALDIIVGYEDGSLRLENPVTRAEFIKIAIAASPYKDNIGAEASVSPYPDVPKSHWAAGYVQAGVSAGLINGYLDGTFRPNNTITLAEGVTIALRLLGYTDADFTGAYPSGQMALYRSMKLDTGMNATKAEDLLTRYDCLYLAYNLLTATNKQGVKHLTSLGYALTAAGEIDLVSLINKAMEGPIIAEGSWESMVPFSVSTANITRNGNTSTLADIKNGDVVYYSKSMRQLWVYHNRVLGTYDRAVPSASNPTGIVVAGNTYSFETSAAAYSVSDLGAFKVGDPIALHLGRDGAVAAVRTPGQSTQIQYGLVTATFNGSFATKDGDSYTSPAIQLTATDGASYTYQYDGDKIKKGDLAQIQISDAGITVSKLSSNNLTGTVNEDGTLLGTTPIASSVEILDTYGDTVATTVHSSRLAGVKFSGSMVRFYATSPTGVITHLILNDVTGDMHQYGVITEATVVSSSAMTSTQSYYTYVINGAPGLASFSTKSFGNFTGPFALMSEDNIAERVQRLKSNTITSVDGLIAHGDGTTYLLAEDYVVYIQESSSKYYLTTWSQVEDGNYTFTGWYDKTESEGGRIRVIIAKEK